MDLKHLPTLPGVYLFKNLAGEIIYIGKAINLKNRVSSYFQKNSSLLPRTQNMVAQISALEMIPVQSEIEALILEARLIKKHYPYFNIRLKDDKDYLYIKITKEEFPTIKVARKRDLDDALDYYGPFPDGTSVRRVLKSLRKIFPYSTCQPNSKKACFYYHLSLCTGVCIGKVTPKEYRKIIRSFRDFMDGKKEKVLKSLEKEMYRQAKFLNFEKALIYKQQIQMIEYVTQPIGRIEAYVENPNLLEDIREKQLEDLANVLGIKHELHRIECYDISHTMGSYTSGSMVVLTDGNPDTNEYRRFRIKTVKGIDDYASLKEVIRRRLHNDWPTPDLMVIDGGKGQLNACFEVLQELKLPYPVIGLAKREEEIFVPGSSEAIKLNRDNKSLQLIQLIRDEAHRFALKYHRSMRSKAFLTR